MYNDSLFYLFKVLVWPLGVPVQITSPVWTKSKVWPLFFNVPFIGPWARKEKFIKFFIKKSLYFLILMGIKSENFDKKYLILKIMSFHLLVKKSIIFPFIGVYRSLNLPIKVNWWWNICQNPSKSLENDDFHFQFKQGKKLNYQMFNSSYEK